MHVLRPLYVVLAIAGIILFARTFVVPEDFGIHESGYMYGWYRKANEGEWRAFKPKYQGQEYCRDCHAEQEQQVRSSRHNLIECENCHGPGTGASRRSAEADPGPEPGTLPPVSYLSSLPHQQKIRNQRH